MRSNRGLWIPAALAFFLFTLGIGALALSAETEYPGIVKGKSVQGFAYMSGGIGSGEREQMEKSAGDYNLKLVFAERSGAYLSAVDLVIKDERGGDIINTTTDGPWFYIKLPQGKYTIEAAVAGVAKRVQDFSIPAKGQRTRFFHWKIEEKRPGTN